MSECVELEPSMTGSTRAGPLKPPVSASPLNSIDKRSSSGHRRPDGEATILRSPSRQEQTRMHHKMTPVRLHSGQPIQLTPLWEHVVRTRRFPSGVDTRETFDEITERLRDPEWEVRQHALRVLVDVLPTLDSAIIDDAMTTVLPELVNNLGHLAPAVRKGALDTLRVYLLCSRNGEAVVEGILNEALIQHDTLDSIRTNITHGVILSTPSLLFPSSTGSRPSDDLIRRAIGALANRLVQVTHQEAALRSLVKIHEVLGTEDFHSYLNELEMNAKRDYEILRDVYKIETNAKPSRRRRRSDGGTKKRESEMIEESRICKNLVKEETSVAEKCECGREILATEERDEKASIPSSPGSRIVLETEIKFNEDTAIKMTIIESNDDDDIVEKLDFESSEKLPRNLEENIALEIKDGDEIGKKDEIGNEWIEKRKTPRRVHFGGEIVKLRTPDSDDSEFLRGDIGQTRIPIPVPISTGSTSVRSRKSRSNPSSPNVLRSRAGRSKSATSSPKREFYVHDASLSPKKSILTTKSHKDSRETNARSGEDSKRKMEATVDTIFGRQESRDESGWAFEIFDNDDYTNSNLVRLNTVEDTKSKRDASKKKQPSSKSIKEEAKNGEIVRTKVESSPPKVSAGHTDCLAITDPKIGKEDAAKDTRERAIGSGHRSEKIGSAKLNDPFANGEMSEEPITNFSTVPNGPAKKSASAKTKRNSARLKSDRSANNQTTNNETNATVALENLGDIVSEKSIESSIQIISVNTDPFQGSTDLSIEEIGPAETDNRVMAETLKNKELGETGANEPAERLELSRASRAKLETSTKASPECEPEKWQELRRPSDECRSFVDREKVAEKFESTNERDVKSCPIDSQYRISPRSSPRKHDFETFPRKERNYILMELSSPVKANLRTDETVVERKSPDTRENNSSMSRDRSPASPSIDRRSIAVATEYRKLNESTLTVNVSNAENFVRESANVPKENNVAESENERAKRNEVFDLEDNSLNDIVIAEPAKHRESNWEDLGLVDQEILDDLHNKEDWRARVRGLERVASALRTPSALAAIEPRLGSLLQAVLGGERSCRVAAAGMSVARVVVAGVSEEALKRRLPQVAWGLARQGGPNAAQLARVAMLRLRPALLLEQLLQPHCIKARNAKTRENALQLLIFSLVTFPSTEFKVENVAYKVATMVADKRRRVRQAALDTLAVLAQIYEPEEVTKAGKLATKGQQDGDSMLAAIRARLARKSLPMVSADGLVLYGLQISPTIQIATGPDVDWIVAGSGSVSPGTGRTRGQIIAATTRQGLQEKNARNEVAKSVPCSKRPNFVALGIGLETKGERERPLAWQLVQHSAQAECRRTREKLLADNGDVDAGEGEKIGTRTRLTGTLRQYRSANDRLDLTYDTNGAGTIFLIDDKDVIMKQRQTEENFHRRMDEIYSERSGIGPISQDIAASRLESRIPVPQSRERETNGKDTARIGSIYPRRRIPQEGNNLPNWSAGSRVSDVSRPQPTRRDDDYQTDINSQCYQSDARDSSPRHLSPTCEPYRSIYRQGRGFADGNVYREVQTAPTNTSYDVTRRRQSLKDSSGTRYLTGSRRTVSYESRASSTTSTTTTMSCNDEGTARASGRPNGQCVGNDNSNFHQGDKNTIEEEENNEINKRHFAVQANSYKIQNSNDRSSQCPARINDGSSETFSNDSSNTSCHGEYERLVPLETVPDDRISVEESFTIENDENVVASPAKGPGLEKSFDVITHETNPSRRSSIDYGISPRNIHSSSAACTAEQQREIDESDETEKDSSGEVSPVIERARSCHENGIINHDSEITEIGNTAYDVARNNENSRVTNECNSSDDGISKLSSESPLPDESRETEVEILDSSGSSARATDPVYAIRTTEANGTDDSSPSTDENDGVEITTMSYFREYPPDAPLESSGLATDPRSSPSPSTRRPKSQNDRRRSRDRNENVISIIVASRPHSRDSRAREEEISLESLDTRKTPSPVTSASNASRSRSSRLDETTSEPNLADKLSANEIPGVVTGYIRDSTNLEKIDRSSNTGNDEATILPEVNGSQASTSEMNQVEKRGPTSRISRMRQKSRTNVARVAPLQPRGQTNDRGASKSRMLAQQCFTQLDSNDWEVTMKGLKGLSQIARQQPEQLDSCAPGTVGRLLGRHVRNLRSQVSRAACLAAGDVFGSQARCIDQDLDDIAGPLLHRTADTNKFLRADSNEALDRMVEYLSPNKTIAVIVHRGSTHQNAIVRATTARLLASIVDRVGPDWTMSMPRDVREKLVATGAKLLMDGNLEARNHAKRMFRKLSRCEGFRKVLRDSVPDTTLRHIDKTLRSL